jgi:hypothetical protein
MWDKGYVNCYEAVTQSEKDQRVGMSSLRMNAIGKAFNHGGDNWRQDECPDDASRLTPSRRVACDPLFGGLRSNLIRSKWNGRVEASAWEKDGRPDHRINFDCRHRAWHGWCDLPITAQIESFAERSLVSVRSGGVLSVAVNSFHAMTALQSRRGRLIHLTLVSWASADAWRAFKHCTHLKTRFRFRW